ncbi:alpha/beta hydrolase [Sulfitobacter sp. S190]|nr:alpha/beta hydrolase [Sulfitobacter sp. S190]
MSKPDYTTLLDAEIKAYLDLSASLYPEGAVDFDIKVQRALYDTMCEAFHAPYPDGVRSHDTIYGGVPCRRYSCGGSDAVVLYFHGGGFVVGGLHSHDDICAEICARSGYTVLSVDYALAPENPFPACYNDAYAAYDALRRETSGPIIIAGDSAGGTLGAAVTGASRVDNRITGQVLIYPGLGGDRTTGSYVTHAHAPELTLADIVKYDRIRAGGAHEVELDPRYAPLSDLNFGNMPPSVLITAACDPLASDGETYRDRVLAAGGKAVWFNEDGLVHGCLRARHSSARAAKLFGRVIAAITDLGQGDWPF